MGSPDAPRPRAVLGRAEGYFSIKLDPTTRGAELPKTAEDAARLSGQARAGMEGA